MSYFPKPYTNKNKIDVKLDLSNYSTKSDLKHATGVDTSKFATKDDLANLKSDGDKIDIDVSADLSKLNNVVNNEVLKKDVYNTDKKRLWQKIEDAEKKFQ